MSTSLAENASAERLSLDIAPDAAHVLTARSFAGAVTRSLELDDETADVLRLTLSEICSEAIEQNRGGRIVIEVSLDTDPVRVTVVASGVRGDQAHGDSIEVPLRRTLIEALVPGTRFDDRPERLAVMFTLQPN